MRLLTAAEMRQIEAHAMENGIASGADLMERAGRRVVDAILGDWPDAERAARRAVVLCGPGNNGGDGFVVARLLQGLGWDVAVRFYGDEKKLSPDARANHDRWRALGPVAALSDDFRPTDGAPDVVVDALFGTGLTRPIRGLDAVLADLRAAVAEGRSRVVSIDMPSGICSDSGRALGGSEAAACADLTVTFHRAKRGHYLADGPTACGRLCVADIGLRPEATEGLGVPLACARPQDLAKSPADHKYGHGHALVLAGSAGRTGAARLAARGALRVGAGLVTLGVPGAAQLEVAAHETAIMLRRVEDAAGLGALLEDARFNALCLGPGLGIERARDLVPKALASGRATVFDADALGAFADAPERLFDGLHDRCVLTPHMGEFGRLFPDIAADLSAPAVSGPAVSRIDACRAAAERAGAFVLLKGADTVIASPDGNVCVHSAAYARAAPWLATAGTGDVLAGMLAGLLARGLLPMPAAETAVWLHVEAARTFGPGLVAEDLPEALPGVFRALGL